MRLPSACPVPSHVRQRTPVFNVEHRHTPAADGTPSSHSKHTVRQPLSHAAALPTPEYASDQGGWDLHTDREPGCSAPWVVGADLVRSVGRAPIPDQRGRLGSLSPSRRSLSPSSARMLVKKPRTTATAVITATTSVAMNNGSQTGRWWSACQAITANNRIVTNSTMSRQWPSSVKYLVLL